LASPRLQRSDKEIVAELEDLLQPYYDSVPRDLFERAVERLKGDHHHPADQDQESG